jgi:hypothetical protein
MLSTVQLPHLSVRSSLLAAMRLLAMRLLLTATLSVCNADERGSSYHTGRAFHHSLQQQMNWSSKGAELASQLNQWQDQSNILLILDRRINPHESVTVKAGTSTRANVLSRICGQRPDTGWCTTERFVYVGPSLSAWRLPVMLELQQIQFTKFRNQLTPTEFRKLMNRSSIAWDRLSEPRRILTEQAGRVGLMIENPEEIPHDVWDAGNWGALTFTELSTIMLNQFDLMLVPGIASASVRVSPIEMSRIAEFEYSVGRQQKEQMAAAVRDLSADLQEKWRSETMSLTGTLQHHAELYRVWQTIIHSANNPVAIEDSLRTRRFTLTVARATIGQLTENFRSNGISIEFEQADEVRMQSILKKEIQLDLKSVAGTDFFMAVYGQYFESVIVEDNRVILRATN